MNDGRVVSNFILQALQDQPITVSFIQIFSSPVQMYRKSYCTTPRVGGGGGSVDKMLKFYIKSFYLMGKAITGKLSCTWTGLVAKIYSCRIFFSANHIIFQQQQSDIFIIVKNFPILGGHHKYGLNSENQ